MKLILVHLVLLAALCVDAAPNGEHGNVVAMRALPPKKVTPTKIATTAKTTATTATTTPTTSRTSTTSTITSSKPAVSSSKPVSSGNAASSSRPSSSSLSSGAQSSSVIGMSSGAPSASASALSSSVVSSARPSSSVVPSSAMSSAASASASASASGCVAPIAAPSSSAGTSDANNYVILFKDGTDIKSHLTQLTKEISANNCTGGVNNTISFVEPGTKPSYYSGTFDTRILAFIKKASGFSQAVPDKNKPIRPEDTDAKTVSARSSRISRTFSRVFRRGTNADAHWGLTRIAQKDRVAESGLYTYDYPSSGAGVRVYVIDSGFVTTHTEFSGRIKPEIVGKLIADKEAFLKSKGKLAPQSVWTLDYTGHGTKVMSSVAGATAGVAPGATIVPVRVCYFTPTIQAGIYTSNTTPSSILSAFEAIIADFNGLPTGEKKGVIVISLDLTEDPALYKKAFKDANDAGLHIAKSAGNDYKDVCTEDVPAGNFFNVGGSDIKDQFARWGKNDQTGSNYGPCVNIIAPAKDIKVADPSTPDKLVIASGTSYAAPAVGGVIARILEKATVPISPADMIKQVKALAVPDAIADAPQGTVSDLLQAPSV